MRHRILAVLSALAALGIFPGIAAATTPTPSPTPTATATPAVGEVMGVRATASTNDGNLPANTLDNNLQTRWSGYGDGASITFDMGSPPRRLAFLKIAVYRGNERRNRFDLQVSSDGTTWTPMLTNALTSGITTLEETWEMPDPYTRFVRYVGHGSTVGLYNSLTEVSLFTYQVQPWCTVTVSDTTVAPGGTVVVTANSDLGNAIFGLSVIDSSTGAVQSETDPIFSPARPAPINVGRGPVSWTMTAVRPGTVVFRVGVSGETWDPVCNCFRYTNASGSSGPVTVSGGPVTPTPTPTATPTPLICPSPTSPPPPPAPTGVTAIPGDGLVRIRWYSFSGVRYEIGRSTTSGGPYASIAFVTAPVADTTTYTDTTVSNGTRYYYVVRRWMYWTYGTPPCPVNNYSQSSAWSAEVSAIPDGTLTPTPTPTPTLAPIAEITPPGAQVSASTNDGNLPANTVDNSLSTRWSGYGEAWIRFDLGSVRTVSHVRIAVYRGNERRARFDLEASADNATWTALRTGVESSGTTTAEETYDFADAPARYLRYVGHGSSAGLWNSLTEVSVFGR